MSKEEAETTINTLGLFDPSDSIILGGMLLLLRYQAKYQEVEVDLAKEKKQDKELFDQTLFKDSKKATNTYFFGYSNPSSTNRRNWIYNRWIAFPGNRGYIRQLKQTSTTTKKHSPVTRRHKPWSTNDWSNVATTKNATKWWNK